MRSPESLFLFLEDLIRGHFGNVFRAKGQLPAGDTWLQFDVADSRYSIIDCEQATDSEVVFIGTDIHRQPIRRLCMTKITAGRRYSRPIHHNMQVIYAPAIPQRQSIVKALYKLYLASTL